MKAMLLTLFILFAGSGCGARQTETQNAQSAPAADNSTNAQSANGGKYSPKEVIATMNTVKDAVKACGNGTGVVKVKFRILESGEIESVEAIDEFAGTDIGTCAEKAVMNARFRPTDAPVNITYPFKL
ncbi:MAG: energy transducer TonB [Deltaproteobacteria bacterium]|nr:energy transducer TonB [Deltaproteobacteria bacterium]